MKRVRGVWLPDHESHLLQYATKEDWTYQKSKLDAAMQYCPKRGVAIDIGGHCGLWSRHLVDYFEHVTAFEPVHQHRQCYVENVKGMNYTLHDCGLGSEEKLAAIHTTDGSSGDSWVMEGDEIEIKTLDSFNLLPDFIKIDTEGYESRIIQGGEWTIRSCKPIMVVEQKPGKGSNLGVGDLDAIHILRKWGAKVAEVKNGDYINTW